MTAAPELILTVAVPALTAWLSVIGPAVLTKSMSPLVVTTPVAPNAAGSAAIVPTVNPLVSRNWTAARFAGIGGRERAVECVRHLGQIHETIGHDREVLGRDHARAADGLRDRPTELIRTVPMLGVAVDTA